jgi:threonine/homoserine/homoserine lactone efflux protein
MVGALPFILGVLVLLATPGPTNTLLAASGASVGLVRSLKLVPAELAGYLASILAIGLLIGPALWNRPWTAVAVRAAVALYLVLLCLRLWRGRDATEGETRVGPATVFLTTLLNPKAAIFALVIIPMQDAHWPLYIVAFAGMMCAMSVTWMSAGAFFGRGFAMRHGGQIIDRIGAVAIAGFAGLVLWPVLVTIAAAASL